MSRQKKSVSPKASADSVLMVEGRLYIDLSTGRLCLRAREKDIVLAAGHPEDQAVLDEIVADILDYRQKVAEGAIQTPGLRRTDRHPSRRAGLEKKAGTDGRRARGERTKQALIEAYLDVASKKKGFPTTQEVARRSGVARRSLFERFGNLGNLALAAFDYALEDFPRVVPGDVVKADRQTRIRFHIGTQAENCESWRRLWQLGMRAQGSSQSLDRRIESIRALMRGRLEFLYRTELEGLAEPVREATLIALEALTDWACWIRMREHYRLSYEQALSVWFDAVDRLLPKASSGKDRFLTNGAAVVP